MTLLVYQVLAFNVGRARVKYKVLPPETTGNPNFERVLRVQQNTLEQLVFFLPLLWLFSFYVSPLWGALVGAVWLMGRILYAWRYYQVAERTIGFAISFISGIVLLLGSLFGIILSVVSCN